MKTDSIFYRIFSEIPTTFFELLDQSGEIALEYKFASVEVKQTSFRIDGVFISEIPKNPIYFVEVQFQRDDRFFERTISEIFLYLGQNEFAYDWQFIIWVPNLRLLKNLPQKYQVLSPNIKIYALNEIAEVETKALGVRVVDLVVCDPKSAEQKVKSLLADVKNQVDIGKQRTMLDLIQTVLVYKFEKLSLEELQTMFGLSELKQTRVYQEGRVEGRVEGKTEEARLLLLRQLTKRFRSIPPTLISKIEQLSLERLEDLGEALLDFNNVSDLDTWLLR
jgi:predicted transposase/invertase (TIGR01784 family)